MLLERKIVSVVFVDLVGFTAMSEALDPEEVRRLLGPYYQRVREELEGYGGTVEKFIGDAVMALFGAPVAHEDDAERAVRAGYAVLQAVRRLPSDGTAAALRVRIGIATGEAVVDVNARPRRARPPPTATSSTRPRGCRRARRPTASWWTSAPTGRRASRSTSGRSRCCWRRARPSRCRCGRWCSRARGTGADPARLQRPLVGRAHETQVLIDALGRAVAGGEPQIVTLVGPPGIGKSRQVWQLLRHLEGETDMVFWRQGRSLPYGDGVTFWALGEIVKANAGILATDPAANVEEKLRIAVEYVVTMQTRRAGSRRTWRRWRGSPPRASCAATAAPRRSRPGAGSWS